MQIQLITKEDISQLTEMLNELKLLLLGKPTNNVYTTQQLANKLDVSTKTIAEWRKMKLIDFTQVGNKIFFTEQAVSEFLNSHSIKRFYNSKNKRHE
jgi:excisionase family DNA binding protein